MHWTLQTNLWLCAACLALNVWQYRRVGSVRESGMLICAAWIAQEAVWFSGIDGIPALIFGGACDMAIACYLLYWSAPVKMDRLVIALLPSTLACGIYQEYMGVSAAIWWLNWYLVTAQMLLGMPWPSLQKASCHYSHGSMKQASIRG